MKLLLVASLVAAILQSSQATHTVHGTIIRADNGAPIPGVSVTTGSWSATTDEYGAFTLEGVTAGQTPLSLKSNDYAVPRDTNSIVSNVIGQLAVTAQQSDVSLHMELIPVGTITGRLFNPDGTPATNIRPILMRARYQDGKRIISNMNGNIAWVTSDDHGDYRLFGVPAGEYYLCIQPPGNIEVATDSASPTYFPSTLNIADAQEGRSILDAGLKVGSESPSPLEVVVGTSVGKIYGTIVNEKAEGMSFRDVVLVPNDPHRRNFGLYKTTTADAEGKFVFSDVPPGDYKAFSWTAISPSAWTNGDILRKYEERGASVTVKGRQDSKDVRVVRIPLE